MTLKTKQNQIYDYMTGTIQLSVTFNKKLWRLGRYFNIILLRKIKIIQGVKNDNKKELILIEKAFILLMTDGVSESSSESRVPPQMVKASSGGDASWIRAAHLSLVYAEKKSSLRRLRQS